MYGGSLGCLKSCQASGNSMEGEFRFSFVKRREFCTVVDSTLPRRLKDNAQLLKETFFYLRKMGRESMAPGGALSSGCN